MNTTNHITLECLYKNLSNSKLKFNTSKRCFYVPVGSQKKHKKPFEGIVDDNVFIEALRDDSITVVSVDVDLFLLNKLYDHVNFRVFKKNYEEDEEFRFILEREILSRGLGWQANKAKSLRIIFGTWKRAFLGQVYNKNTIVGFMTTREYRDDIPSCNEIITESIMRSDPRITMGYSHRWEPKQKITSVRDMQRIANKKKLKGIFFSDFYYLYTPSGFNESTIKNCIGFIYDLHPCFRRNTICELYDEVMSE